MTELFRIRRRIELQDDVDEGKVQAPSCYVCAQKNGRGGRGGGSGGIGGECKCAFWWGNVSVQGVKGCVWEERGENL